MSTLAVIVTYKNPKQLKTCCDSIEGIPIYIRDNSEDNVLYTQAINDGIRAAQEGGYDYTLVCCDDVIVRPGAIAAMEAFLDANEECGIAMPVQVDKKGEVTCGGCTDAFPYGKHIILPLTHEIYREPFESFWANGACFLLRNETARECGLLDSNMKFICSDSDYSFTIRARGWKIFVVPSAIVEHEPRGALASTNMMLEKQKDEDAFYFANKWLSGGLYQRVSHEGPTLKAQEVSQQLHILSWRIAEGYKK